MMAFSTQSLGLLAALSSFATASIGTTTITSVYTTTAVTTSTSTVANCAVSGSAQITCSDGFYNTYGAIWEEYCAASVNGGSLILSGTGLSLRACMSACSVRSTCSGVYWDATARICYLLAGEWTITPGGPYQAAYRYSPEYQPCESTIVSTVVDTVTSLVVSTYTIIPTPTPTPTPDPVVSSSSTSTSSISSPPASPRSSPSSSRPVIPSGPPTIPASSHIPTPSPPPSSVTSTTISTTIENGSGATQIPVDEDDDCTEVEDATTETSTSATNPGATHITTSQTLPPTTTVPMTTSTVTVTEVHTLTACPLFVRGCPASEQTTYTTTETIDIYTTIYPVTATETSLSDVPITTQAPLPHPAEVTTISTVYQTSVHTITGCPPSVTDCPADQQTTYLSTETLPNYATVTLIPVKVPTANATGVPEIVTGSGSNEAGTDGPLNSTSPSQQAPPTFTTSVTASSSPAAARFSSSEEQAVSDTPTAVGSAFTGAASVLAVQPAYPQIAAGLFCLAAAALI